MSLAYTPDRLQLPDSLQAQLHEFRRRVWTIKTVEAVAAAAFGVLVAYLLLFCLDRVVGHAGLASHRPVRRGRGRLRQYPAGLCTAGSGGIAGSSNWPGCWRESIPGSATSCWASSSWCATTSSRPARARLCEAAVREVAHDAQPSRFPRRRSATRGIGSGSGWRPSPWWRHSSFFALFPAAAANAWQRFLLPWKTPRATLHDARAASRDDRRPPRRAVLTSTCARPSNTVWRPETGGRAAWRTDTQSSPVERRPLRIRAAAADRSRLAATSRSATRSASAHRADPAARADLDRGVRPAARVSRPSRSSSAKTCAAVRSRSCMGSVGDVHRHGQPRAAIRPGRRPVARARRRDRHQPADARSTARARSEFRWQDQFGLAGKEPFVLAITGREDEAPSLTCEDLPRQKVVLDTELLELQGQGPGRFWHQANRASTGKASTARSPATPAKGERILAAGGHDKESLEISGTFSAQVAGNRAPAGAGPAVRRRLSSRAASASIRRPTCSTCLNAEQHAIWVTEQLSKWHRQSLEVRDKEMQLYETNKQLRALAAEELDRPETRRKIENQAAAERANGRRLSA